MHPHQFPDGHILTFGYSLFNPILPGSKLKICVIHLRTVKLDVVDSIFLSKDLMRFGNTYNSLIKRKQKQGKLLKKNCRFKAEQSIDSIAVYNGVFVIVTENNIMYSYTKGPNKWSQVSVPSINSFIVLQNNYIFKACNQIL